MRKGTLSVLVIDDDRAHCAATAEIVRRLGHEVRTAGSGEEGIALLREGGIDLVVTDLVMRDRSGLDVIVAATGGPEVIVMTGFGSEEAAPAALRAGATAYVMKPIGVEMFRSLLDRVARRAKARRARRSDGDTCFQGMVAASAPMGRLFDLVRRVADSRATALIEGESGTGKELVARAIHALSPRASGPFVAVNCAALAPGILESELFGHERGAFTGAYVARAGRFEAADGGTLFLDEVSEMDGRLQAKLLRAVEAREVVRVGGNDARQVDVRLVAATNLPLRERVSAGEFRADLFFRLNVVRVRVPPLRERAGDIPLLVDAFLSELSAEHGVERPDMDPTLLRRLQELPWPGNVRELRNTVEAMLLTGGPRLGMGDLPADAPAAAPRTPLSMRPIADVERELIQNTLKDVQGNRTRAAEALGISARTLYRRIKELGLGL
ncbi:MAG TPA: sigma-54 dependent transcriptional regulator [Planctomycetota bacterium]|nr:sigma-54 dependent transcriptional regulator [Planctomycetota bacterium]